VAGSIYFTNGKDWQSSTSAFFWAVNAMAERASDPELAAHLREFFDEGVRILGFYDIPVGQHAELLSLVRQLPEVARAIPANEKFRDYFIVEMDELAKLAS
jgi:hypothetical protein